MDDFPDRLAIALIGGAIIAGPLFGAWPLVGILAAIGASLYLGHVLRR